MACHDMRSVSDDQVSFFVIDDLRYKQNPIRPDRPGWDIFRYDTLEQALAKFLEIPADMKPALCMHKDARSELDLIHRSEGEYVLVSDYQNTNGWRHDPTIQDTIEKLCSELKVEWRMDSICFLDTILVPAERNFHRIPDKGLTDKNLRPQKPKLYGQKEHAITAVNEVYSPQHGWISLEAAANMAQAYGFDNPHIFKATQFNVNYVDLNGHFGQRDVTPMELSILRERWDFQHEEEAYKVSYMAKKFAEELDEFFFSSFGADHATGAPDKETAINRMKEDILSGDTKAIVKALQEIRDDSARSDKTIAQAQRLLARVEGLHNTKERKPALDNLIQDAGDRSGNVKKGIDMPEQQR